MITSYYKKTIMDVIAGQLSGGTGSQATLPVGYYLGLSTTTPTAGTATGTDAGSVTDCNFTEPSDSNYQRIFYNKIAGMPSGYDQRYPFAYPVGTTTYDTVSNSYEIHWNVATQNWGTITHVGFFSANGKLLAYTALTNSIAVNTGNIATILLGDAVISLEAE